MCERENVSLYSCTYIVGSIDQLHATKHILSCSKRATSARQRFVIQYSIGLSTGHGICWKMFHFGRKKNDVSGGSEQTPISMEKLLAEGKKRATVFRNSFGSIQPFIMTAEQRKIRAKCTFALSQLIQAIACSSKRNH